MKAEHFESLVEELRHLVDHHGVDETTQLWKSDRAQLDAVHSEAHRAENTTSVEGITRWSRGKDDSPCVCHDGAHVFGYSVELIDPPENKFPAHVFNPLDAWIYQQITSAPEGARLRFTVEVLDPPDEGD